MAWFGLVALVMVVAGLGFKITAVPFHFYAPDVYQGAPTVAAAILAFAPKVAGFVALFRVLGFVLAGDWSPEPGRGLALSDQVPSLFWILAAVTMTLGNLLALLQDNVKRMLAYSSVAHAGYMLMGLAAAPDLRGSLDRLSSGVSGLDVILFYLVAYGAMTVGAFGVLAYLSTPERPVETVDDLAGLGRSHPGVAVLMMVFLFSLIGMPLTAGFVGKLFLFWGSATLFVEPGLEHGYLFLILTVIGALNAAVGAWYYLRVLVRMYLHAPLRPLTPARSWPGLATLWVCALVTLVLGVYPEPLLKATHAAVLPPQQADAAAVGEQSRR
jgi:NADH-quinone oxidoreductase subunit N